MRDAIEEYLNRVMGCASLARNDQARVRAELKEHLAELVAEAQKYSSAPEEIATFLEKEFGKPEMVGKEISNARGRAHTSLKKLKRSVPIAVAVCLVMVFSIRWAVAEPFYVPGKGAEPIIHQGSRVLVYKLGSVFRVGDVIAFRSDKNEILLGIVKADEGSILKVSRNGEADRTVQHARVIGRVVAHTP